MWEAILNHISHVPSRAFFGAMANVLVLDIAKGLLIIEVKKAWFLMTEKKRNILQAAANEATSKHIRIIIVEEFAEGGIRAFPYKESTFKST